MHACRPLIPLHCKSSSDLVTEPIPGVNWWFYLSFSFLGTLFNYQFYSIERKTGYEWWTWKENVEGSDQGLIQCSRGYVEWMGKPRNTSANITSFLLRTEFGVLNAKECYFRYVQMLYSDEEIIQKPLLWNSTAVHRDVLPFMNNLIIKSTLLFQSLYSEGNKLNINFFAYEGLSPLASLHSEFILRYLVWISWAGDQPSYVHRKI